jgi:hypothetical protein
MRIALWVLLLALITVGEVIEAWRAGWGRRPGV